jgi:hypothetical protein
MFKNDSVANKKIGNYNSRQKAKDMAGGKQDGERRPHQKSQQPPKNTRRDE